MIGQLLFGSIVLPLGDFSLLNELPRMYRAYEKVVSPDEKGILDFVGDYLLNGKDLLGHNRYDQPSKPGSMQFQHAATFAMISHQDEILSKPLLTESVSLPKAICLPFSLSDYHSQLFRPPLAQA